MNSLCEGWLNLFAEPGEIIVNTKLSIDAYVWLVHSSNVCHHLFPLVGEDKDEIIFRDSNLRNGQSVVGCRYGANERYRIIEDKLMRKKARFLLDEAASWSLLWYLYGKGNMLN